MALVSYGMSDASDSEEENTAVEVTVSKPKTEGLFESTNDGIDDFEDKSLFSVVPTPKTTPVLLDSDGLKKLLLNKPAPRKIEKKVKITVPSLSEFDEELPVPVAKKVTASRKGTGLFSLLPPPKNTGMAATLRLMPDSLKKAPKPRPVVKPVVKPLPRPTIVAAPIVEENDSDDDTSGDFFSLNKPKESEITMESPIAEPFSYVEEPVVPEPEIATETCVSNDYIPVSNDNLELDEEALMKLCGGNKRKRNAFQAQLIDVSEKDVVPDKSEWLMKALTEEKKTRSSKPKGGPSSQQKRKHQITYLAHQAKDMEEELQGQWANNRMNKKQTQSKYGF